MDVCRVPFAVSVGSAGHPFSSFGAMVIYLAFVLFLVIGCVLDCLRNSLHLSCALVHAG